MKTGIELIAEERKRQVVQENWSSDHDDRHKKFQLAKAASCYAMHVADAEEQDLGVKSIPCDWWPWGKKWWKPSEDPVRNLVKAGALIAAEIDRLLRRNGIDPIPASDNGFSSLHLWWELSYASYLTIPRSVMQSMPDPWQAKMAALLNELDETIDWRPRNGCYQVQLRDYSYDRQNNLKWGRKIEDPLEDYQRGRRIVSEYKKEPKQ